MVNTLDCGSSTRGFDPHRSPHEILISLMWDFFLFVKNNKNSTPEIKFIEGV